VRQVWFDDPHSLSLKYAVAKSMGLRGVGVWELDSLDYNSTDPVVVNQTAAMWAAIGATIPQ
jgi:di-N-acetylchitobiase